MPEFLVHFTVTFPPGISPDLKARLYEEERRIAAPLLQAGYFRRCWREPGTHNHWALWCTPDANFIHQAYSGFPLWQQGYGVATVIPLARNHNDPGWPGPDPGAPIKLTDGEPTAHLHEPIDDGPGLPAV
jgi:muconolactone delta-isomerase